ncbi:MAG: hypothetical protein ACUVSX_02105 [Aggregatilineales bacterium]
MSDPVIASRAARSDLERGLLAALAQGPAALVEQAARLLDLSQLAPAAPVPGPALPAEAARVVALALLAETLPETDVIALYHAAGQLADPVMRLRVLARVALRLPPQLYQAAVRRSWQEASALSDPAARAYALFQLAPLLTLYHDEPAAPPALLEIVALAQAINNPEARIRSLAALAPYLPQRMRLRVLRRAVDEMDQLHSDAARFNALNALADHLLPELEGRVLHNAEAIRSPSERARAFTALARHLPMALRPALRAGAISAIAAIRDEEERAGALIAFAPHLEYVTNAEQFPHLLERALRIAIGLKRPHLRARALVALAPHLTPDLQVEAVAVVNGLANERERAALLADLAPTLMPDMVMVSLAAIYNLETQDVRAHALSVFAQYVPESARDQTLLDALAAANNLSRPYERVVALMRLMDALPASLREQTCANALESARLTKNESACARALGLIGLHLSPALAPRALEIARALVNPAQRLVALNSLLPFLAGADRASVTEELLEVVQEMPFEYHRARALAEIVPLLPDDLIPQALRVANDIEDPFDRVSALVAFIPRLTPEQSRRTLADCWRLVRAIDNGYDAACALAAIAPLLPPAAGPDLARSACMIIGAIMDEYDQASAIALLAPLLTLEGAPGGQDSAAEPVPERHTALEQGVRAALRISDQTRRWQLLAEGAALCAESSDNEQLYHLWREVAVALADLPLADALLCLSAMAPVVQRLGGDDALAAVARLLQQR